MDGERPPKVFISYSHDSDEHKDRVLDLALRLCNEGIVAEIDQYADQHNPSPHGDWPLWCERQMDAADFLLIVCTEIYHRRFKGDEEQGKGRGVFSEADFIRRRLYSGADPSKFIPVLFSDSSPEHIPTRMQGSSWYFADQDHSYENLYRRLTGQPRVQKPELGKLRKLPSIQPKKRKWSELPPETTTANVDGRETLAVQVDAPVSCETTESSFHYSDQHVLVDAYLPRVEKHQGVCRICVKQDSLKACEVFVGHREILSTLFHGHHRGINAKERLIIAHGPSRLFDKFAIDIVGSRMYIGEKAVRSLFLAIDAVHDAYIDALRRIDLAWEAEGFSYYQKRKNSEVVVCLGRLPAWLWSRIVEFATEHHYERGDTEWHMFEATSMSVMIWSRTSTKKFDEGLHAVILASNQSPAETLNSDEIALLWKPSPSFPQSREVYPLSERRYWGAATTSRWINDELIPKTYEWIWSKQPRAKRWSAKSHQHKDRFISELIDLGGLVNDVPQASFALDLTGLRCLVSTLQSEFHCVSDEKYVFTQSDCIGLYRAIILVLKLQQVEDDRLYYVATNLSASPGLDSNGLIQTLENMIKDKELPSNCFSVDLGLRSLLHLLRSRKVYLNRQEAREIIGNLGPLMELYRDREIKRRHALTQAPAR